MMKAFAMRVRPPAPHGNARKALTGRPNLYGGEQLIGLGVLPRLVVVPEYFTLIECGCPFFRLEGTLKLNA